MINFLKYKTFYFVLSSLVLVPGLVSLVTNGLKLSIDFTGGSQMEVLINDQDVLNSEQVREVVLEEVADVLVKTTDKNGFIIKTSPIDRQAATKIKEALSQNFGEVEETRFETVGPTLGSELVRKTLVAVALAAGAILIYVMFQFKNLKYGVCAILAMFHDSLILFGVFSLLGHFYSVEVDVLFVTAVLTVLSFSVHDTIVVYDRIRETLRKNPKADYEEVVNKSITETLGRSINNSMTIIFMLLALWLMGGETTKWFVFALLVGTIAGTYSSTFTAAPLLVIWDKFFSKR
jgi:preprotein translocase subunit SecF